MTIILAIDDIRIMPWCTEIARTSYDGIALLERYRDSIIDELWLDHDLGGDDTIRPVVALLEEAAFHKAAFKVSVIYIHSSNPSGANAVLSGLLRWEYNARRVPAPACGTIYMTPR